ncbi:hypothetical protein LTS18_007032 [Coniosporium uncinatum]|uniref:Uncharacterized protein n=1 Tax=Coniosporium uncinatum TaxID=93489 RepID=A0ACC3D319_9PEZI|nr:hypothetical protein LTS18_007032 [Coniosporium uncinatum]
MAGPPRYQTLQLGARPGTVVHPIVMPAPQTRTTWNSILNSLPHRITMPVVGHLLGGPDLASANFLQADTAAVDVRRFLSAIQQAMPRVNGQGATIINREVIATTTAGITTAFPDDTQNFLTVQTAIGYHPSAQQPTLTLTSTGPGLVWATSPINIGWQEAIAALTANPQAYPGVLTLAQAQQAQANDHEAHRRGQADWHNVVVFIYRRITFIYDPSALTLNTANPQGLSDFQAAALGNTTGAGIDSHNVPHLNIANRLYSHGFNNTRGASNLGRLGKRNTTGPCWIGGGGNVVGGPIPGNGECRAMCGNFIVVVALLVYMSLNVDGRFTATQVVEAAQNLDWLLGGKLDGSGAGLGVGLPEWFRIRLY